MRALNKKEKKKRKNIKNLENSLIEYELIGGSLFLTVKLRQNQIRLKKKT